MRPATILALAALMSPVFALPTRADIILSTSDRNVYAEDGDGNSDSKSGLPGFTTFNATTSASVPNASASQNSQIAPNFLAALASAGFERDAETYNYADTNFYVVFRLTIPHTYSFSGSVSSDDPDGTTSSLFTLIRQEQNAQIPIITLFDNDSITQSGVLPAGNYVLNAFASADNSSFDFGEFGTQQLQNSAGFQFQLNVTATPEPSSLGIVGMLGLCGWVARRRRQA